MAGHYRVVLEADGSRRVVLFGAHVALSGMGLEFYELDESGKCVEQVCACPAYIGACHSHVPHLCLHLCFQQGLQGQRHVNKTHCLPSP